MKPEPSRCSKVEQIGRLRHKSQEVTSKRPYSAGPAYLNCLVASYRLCRVPYWILNLRREAAALHGIVRVPQHTRSADILENSEDSKYRNITDSKYGCQKKNTPTDHLPANTATIAVVSHAQSEAASIIHAATIRTSKDKSDNEKPASGRTPAHCPPTNHNLYTNGLKNVVLLC